MWGKFMGKLRVLLVEDHLGERLNLIKFLNQYSAEVDTAVTFNRARDLASKRTYDLVISELLLSHCPDLQGDGIQFWNFVQKMHPGTPVLLVAHDSVRATTEMLLENAERPAIISRPVCPHRLKKTVEEGVEFFRKNRVA